MIQIFKNEVFGEIRTLTNEKGETFFVGKDVAEALGYSDTQKSIRMHVDEERPIHLEYSLPQWLQNHTVLVFFTVAGIICSA